VGSLVIQEGGLFLMGKYDQMQQSKPFAALASAFGQYCEVLISQKETKWVKMVVNKMQVALGRDAIHLAKVIPKLGQLLGVDVDGGDSLDLDDHNGNAAQRLQFLLCQFVEIMSTNSVVSVTLFLDDLQWADAASISVLKRLLTQARNRFFLLGNCRDDEVSSNHPLCDMIESARTMGVNVTTVQLDGMREEAVNCAVSELLCLSPRLVRSLSSIVFSKTKGNPLFFTQLMLSLTRDGLLRIDLSSQRWVWDEEKICSAKLPDNVALCFTNGIKQLSIEVQLALHTLSMFGASAKSVFIKALETQLNANVTGPLKIAAAEGLISYVKDSYNFAHDRIQEACYKMIQEHDRVCNHLTYGRCLAKLALETGNDDMFFCAVNQINLGGPSAISDREDYFIMATYNLMAGKRAMAMSEFHTAYNLFDNGINFLRKNHWHDNYSFSLEIFDLAAKAALASGNTQALRILTDHVLRRGRCFEDKLNAHFILMSSRACSSLISEALENGLEIVSQLGEEIPKTPTPDYVGQQIQYTLAITSGISHEFVSNMVMVDTQKLALMRFLAKLSELSFFVNHQMVSIIELLLEMWCL
jgi:predicted ATPase